MAKVTLSQALEMLDIGRSKIYQDAKDGVISTETDKSGKKVVDTAELERVYGQLRNPTDNPESSEKDGHGHTNGHAGDRPEQSAVVRILEEQVSTLKEQLTQAGERAEELKADKKELGERLAEAHKMLSAEQEKTKILMLPSPEGKGSWLDFFRRRR